MVVDRMNLTEEQRSNFVSLARLLSCECHAVVLDTPVEECVRRVRGRVDHEGGFGGPGADAVRGARGGRALLWFARGAPGALARVSSEHCCAVFCRR